ncbi:MULTISPECIES: hypothetical protein [unclassified Shewanella]|uniref:hypothetical protein n=1 Tax=unclassified Shewanella TaxID=196818 RepID=UPI003550F45E
MNSIIGKWNRADKSIKDFTIKEVVTIVLCFLMGIAFSYLSFYFFLEEFGLLFFDVGDFIYIKENSGRLFSILFVFGWGYFSLAFFQRLVGFEPSLAIKRMTKSLILAAVVFFVGVIPVNLATESNLELQGYSYCHWYTGPSFRSPDVWLKDESLCLKSGAVIRSDIEDFFEQHNKVGTAPTLTELESFITETKLAREDYIHGR